MISKIGKLVFILKGYIRKHRRITKKEHASFSSNTLNKTMLEKIRVQDIEEKYCLRKKQDVWFLSTAAPQFVFEGHSEKRPYFHTRIPVDSSKYSREFNMSNKCASGSAVLFKTDSKHIIIQITLERILNSTNMTLLASAGIDIYEKKDNQENWLGCYAPKNQFENEIHCKIVSDDMCAREIKIYLPLFSQVQLIQIGLDKDSFLYEIKKIKGIFPIAIYGSSITQGCACSRPALCYANLIKRNINVDIYNFGFSGSARGEEEIAQYIAGLALSAIIMEYDHNVDVLQLQQTHYDHIP